MPTPCREQLVAALATKLAAIAGFAGLEVERDREEPVTGPELPRLVVYEGDEQLSPEFSGEDGFELQIDVEGYAASADMPGLRAAVDVAVFADRTLGGLARDIEFAVEQAPQRLDMDQAAGAKGFARSYRLLHATREGDPFTFA